MKLPMKTWCQNFQRLPSSTRWIDRGAMLDLKWRIAEQVCLPTYYASMQSVLFQLCVITDNANDTAAPRRGTWMIGNFDIRSHKMIISSSCQRVKRNIAKYAYGVASVIFRGPYIHLLSMSKLLFNTFRQTIASHTEQHKSCRVSNQS